jgi:eukaryotic-like serine/threonine-protein kinase
MSGQTREQFLWCVERSEVVERNRLAQAVAEIEAADPQALGDCDRLADALIERKLLTRWQTDNLRTGKCSGFILGQYKLLGLLGTGHSSSIYLGEHTRMGALRAIKVLPGSRVNNLAWLARFARDAMTLAKLRHPNIATAFDINSQRRHHYIVLEYIDGRSLQATIEADGPLDPKISADVIRQGAEALVHAHAKGFVHRDIKPSHLMIGRDGTVFLIGWSMSRSIGELSPTPWSDAEQNLWTTFDYVAPEQALDHDLVDPRADVYSLGCTLYFAITGHVPFAGHSPAQRIDTHQTAKPPTIADDRSDIARDLDKLCLEMMAQAATDRPQTAAEVAGRLPMFGTIVNGRWVWHP